MNQIIGSLQSQNVQNLQANANLSQNQNHQTSPKNLTLNLMSGTNAVQSQADANLIKQVQIACFNQSSSGISGNGSSSGSSPEAPEKKLKKAKDNENQLDNELRVV